MSSLEEDIKLINLFIFFIIPRLLRVFSHLTFLVSLIEPLSELHGAIRLGRCEHIIMLNFRPKRQEQELVDPVTVILALILH